MLLGLTAQSITGTRGWGEGLVFSLSGIKTNIVTIGMLLIKAGVCGSPMSPFSEGSELCPGVHSAGGGCSWL